MADRIRLKWKGEAPFDENDEPNPRFPGEHFATIPTRDLTDEEYAHRLDDEERAMVASRPDLYQDHGSPEDAEKARADRAKERETHHTASAGAGAAPSANDNNKDSNK